MLRSLFSKAAVLLASLQVLPTEAAPGTFKRAGNVIDINALVLNKADATAWSIIVGTN